MFIPMWLIVVIIVVAVLYVLGVNAQHKENVHRVKSHMEGLKIEFSWAEKNLANDIYRLAYHFLKHKQDHAKEVIYLLKKHRDYYSVDRAERFLSEPSRFKEELDEALNDIQNMTGFDLDEARFDQQGYEWYKEEELKYDESIEEIRKLMNEVKNELD